MCFFEWCYQGLCVRGQGQGQGHETRGRGLGQRLTKTAKTRTRTWNRGQGWGLETKFKAKVKKIQGQNKLHLKVLPQRHVTLPSTGVTLERFCTFLTSLIALYYWNSPTMPKILDKQKNPTFCDSCNSKLSRFNFVTNFPLYCIYVQLQSYISLEI